MAIFLILHPKSEKVIRVIKTNHFIRKLVEANGTNHIFSYNPIIGIWIKPFCRLYFEFIGHRWGYNSCSNYGLPFELSCTYSNGDITFHLSHHGVDRNHSAYINGHILSWFKTDDFSGYWRASWGREREAAIRRHKKTKLT